ncbi:ComEC/Rec2 family competence protein [uncultured Cellulomonas sp.]|uniref:ComEC/Rec2 family competence protein n=1 Tax=uncultured Cellulomonas sp. TaxID=189682 RepID=UPI00261037F3|nr:ComEC/Rec2 family competence protein [uncultured Cellulomonas sp.]
MRPLTDVRLVPAALVCWAACLVGVRLPPAVAGAVAAGALVASGLVAGAVVAAGAAVARTSAAGASATGASATGAVRPARAHGEVVGHVVLLLVVCAAALGSTASQRTVRDSGLFADLVAQGAQVRVVGTVGSEPVPLRSTTPWGDDGARLRVDLMVEHVSGDGRSGPAAAPVLLLAGPQWAAVGYGSRVSALGTLEPTGPGDDAVALLVVRGPPTTSAPAGPVDLRVAAVRTALLRVSDGLPADQRGLVPGAAIGDTSRIPDDLDRAMRVAGLTHVTAVSGAHFAIVGAVVLAVTALAGLARPARAGVVAAAMVGFVLLVHPQPSVLRAAVMGGVGVCALVLGRPSRAVPGLATCVLVLLVVDPWLATSIGFTLSVVATAGIVLGSSPLTTAMAPPLPDRIARLVAVPLAAQWACGPVVVVLSDGLPTYAVLANIAAAPALVPATVLGVLAAVVAPWWEAGGVACARGAGLAAWWVATVARTAAGLPAAVLPWPAGPVGPLGLAGVTLLVTLALRHRSRRVG